MIWKHNVRRIRNEQIGARDFDFLRAQPLDFADDRDRINDDASGPLRLTMSDFYSETSPAWSPCH